MSIVSRIVVTIVGVATLLVGTQSLFAATDGRGIVRQQQPALDAGCEANAAAGEIGAEADDAGVDATSDHDWITWRSPHPGWWQPAGWARGSLAPPPIVPGPSRTTDVIRGPPARG